MADKEFLKLNIKLFRDGERLKPDQIKIVTMLNDVFEDELLGVTQISIIHCVDENDLEFKSLNYNQIECKAIIEIEEATDFVQCINCGKVAELSQKQPKSQSIVKVLFSNIENAVNAILIDLEFEKINAYEWLLDKFTINYLTRRRTEIPIWPLTFSCFLVHEIQSNDIEIWKKNVFDFLLSKSEDRIVWLNSLHQTFGQDPSLDRATLESYIKSLDELSSTEFEYWYANFLNEISNHPKEYQQTIQKLSVLQGNILGSISIQVGGQLSADTKTFPKLEYYQVLVENIQAGDTKKYGANSTIKIQHFRQLRDYVDEGKGAIVSLSNKVDSSVWSRIFHYRKIKNRFDYVIITRRMLKDLISLFAPWLPNEGFRFSSPE